MSEAKIKVSEIFRSIQGEGRYMGVPSIFLRTFGCNFTCAGFGMPRGQLSTEADQVDPNSVASYGELPLVGTGCDSYASWHPKFKHLSPVLTVGAIADACKNMLPNHQWGNTHLVITGGEPLLGWQRSYISLLNNEFMQGIPEITFETNGTQALSPLLVDYLKHWSESRGSRDSVTFSVSAKLSNSGHSNSEAIKPDVVTSYQQSGFTYLKFVVATDEDVAEVLTVVKQYRSAGFHGPVYLMPVGGVESVYRLNTQRVAELALKHDLRYSDRLQVPLFKNAWGT